MSSIVLYSSPLAQAPLRHSSVSGAASSAIPASSRPLSRIFSVVLAIAAGVPPDGAALKPWPSPKRSASAGTTFTSSAGTPSSPATSCAYSGSLPSASVVSDSTILPVGCTRRKTARYASSATLLLLLVRKSLALLMGSERVVLLEVAERGLRPAHGVRRRRGPLAARVNAELRLSHRSTTPESCCRGSGHARSASPPSCPGPASRSPTSPARRPARGRAPRPERRRSRRRPRPARGGCGR